MKSAFASALLFFAPAFAVAQEVAIGDDCEPVGPIKGSGSCKDDYASCVDACVADCHSCAGSRCEVCIGCRPPCKSPCPTSSTCAFACTDCADCRDKANACAKACAPEYRRCKEALDAQAAAAGHRWVPAELKGKKAAELRLLRNEVFARHGYLFTGDLLFFHFKKERWYTGSRKNVDKLLTDIDRANVEVLKQAERTAAEAELAALPEDFRAFWFEFRAAAATRDTARLGGLTVFPFESNLDKPEKLARENFDAAINELLLSTALEVIKVEVPAAIGDSFRLVTPPLKLDARVGRAYEFRKVGTAYRWTGVAALPE